MSKLTIYRIEAKDGRGPFRSYGLDDYVNTSMPTIEGDGTFPPKMVQAALEKIRTDDDWRFGCTSRAALRDWIANPRGLQEHGAMVVMYEVDKKHVLGGYTQRMFNKKQARIVRKIPMNQFLPKEYQNASDN